MTKGNLVRRLALTLAMAGVLAFLLVRGLGDYASGFPPVGAQDFVRYWAAARLVLDGDNPYDALALLAAQQAVGWPSSELLMVWNPPWTLPLMLPLALLPFRLATLVWLFVQVGLIFGSSVLLWRFFAPGDRRYWIGLLLAAAFIPGWFALRIGQISPWLLAGVAGFLWAERDRRDLLAGGALALLMIKPQITYLFWLAALWWVLRNRRWRVLVGWVVVPVIAAGLVLLLAPDVLSNYLAAPSESLLKWATPTLGAWLRHLFHPAPSWLQFLPSLLGILGLILWLWRRRGPWRWERVASPLLLASVITTSFGWTYDQIVLLPVVVDLVSHLRSARLRRQLAVLGLLILFQVALMVQNQYQIGDQYSVWHAPALAALYGWVILRDREPGEGETQGKSRD